ncbi:MAG: bi-domain-containing oxidoreductase [Planctomycetes bacterium]|nr:bi-domain-containing oxidoreductase [Planctomycetota bacterium]
MRQVTQNVRNGSLSLDNVPAPAVRTGHVLIANSYSLISAGTEKMARGLAQKSLLAKAKERPDHVKRVMEKLRNEGVWNTIQQVREKLSEPMSMGYCSAGVVVSTGFGVSDFQPGDLVASNGGHAEMVCVPKHLCAKVPNNVSLDQAAFAVLGAIAMNGVRLSKGTIGESALVIGLGLVGQISVGLLKAAGLRVIGTDLDPSKCSLAEKMGADFTVPSISASTVSALTGGIGADVVLIAASTSSDAPVELAGEAVRQKGRVVALGAVGMNLPRRPYYFKEAEFVVSCSYGPGRYDPKYEEGGVDYPSAHVRWTEQRNMESVLGQISAKRLDLAPLISHRFAINEVKRAYDLIESNDESYVGIVLEYPEYSLNVQVPTQRLRSQPSKNSTIGIGCLGAGNFARAVLLPALSTYSDLRQEIVCSAGGATAAFSGNRFGFAVATSDEREVIENSNVDALIIATQHQHHASQVLAGLRAGKHVFVEKPLCLTVDELSEIEAEILRADTTSSPIAMVGFNRRFSPAAVAVREYFQDTVEPLTVSIRFNAGVIPEDHWTQDEMQGGGRIIGEACHAIDLATYLVGAPVARIFAECVGGPTRPRVTHDQCFLTLRHTNGSLSSVAYLAGGDKSFPKERIEVMGGGKVAVIDDFRRVETWSKGKRRKLWAGSQDKGHNAGLQSFIEAIRKGGETPISWQEIQSTTLASILAVRSLREGTAQRVERVSTSGADVIRIAG